MSPHLDQTPPGSPLGPQVLYFFLKFTHLLGGPYRPQKQQKKGVCRGPTTLFFCGFWGRKGPPDKCVNFKIYFGKFENILEALRKFGANVMTHIRVMIF